MALGSKKLLFVYNPHAGMAQIKNHLLDIIDTFVKADYEVTAYSTQKEGDAIEVVRDREDSYDLVVCSGGDGTLDEAVRGMLESGRRTPIGYIPAGSTNDFARSLKIPSNMKKAAAVVAEGHPFTCDIGSLNGEFFVYVAAFGVFTEISYTTPQDIKNALGHSAYVLEAIISIPTQRAQHMKVTWDEGTIEGDFIYGMVTNSISVGGFKGITGLNVSLDDGYYEVTLIREPKTPMELNEIVLALGDRRHDSANLISFKTDHVVFESDKEVPWTRDGENGGSHKRAEIDVHPGAVDIMVP